MHGVISKGLILILLVLSIASCAVSPNFGESSLRSVETDYGISLPTDPKYSLTQITNSKYAINVHQGSILISEKYVRLNYLKQAAEIVANEECESKGLLLDEYSFAPVGSVGWVHLQGEFTCINKQYIAENRKPEDKPKLSISTGTGFFITKSGHIVTSSHVISNARSIKIVTESKTVLDAQVIKNEPANDVAILKVDYSPDHSLPLMLDNHVKKGEELVVLGYPLIGLQGQEQKATFGRVNSLSGIRGDTRFIQIDSPIQPGNSGGPVLNQYAEVVGIVTMTVDQAKAYENFGTLTQSVNYALKLDYLEPLLSNIDGFKTSISRKKMPTTDIISSSQNSVVLILVRH